jgi:CheY-like chemotaxis protein
MKKFKKILLIDDDSITNFINKLAITTVKLSNEIKVAASGAEAIDYLKTECSKENFYPDLIFVDINMPGMNGFEFLKEYKKLKIEEEPIIIMLTTSCDPKEIKMTGELGIRMLNKPMTAEMLTNLFGKEEV